VVFNWADEVTRLEPHAPLCVYHGPKRRLDPNAEVTLTSYGILRQDGAALLASPWQTVILDEAQTIKNAASQTAQAAYALGAVAHSRLALTGTPVENRLDELWSQCHFLNPGMLGDLSAFKRGTADAIALAAAPQVAPGSPAHLQGARAAQDLRRRLAPVLLRRTKAQVAQDLPPRTDVVLRCELTEAERAVYNSVQAATRAQVLRLLQSGGTVLQALEALLRLRQAACHTGLLPGHHAPTSSKVALLMDTLQSALDEGHRALVFSQWTGLLDRVEPHLRAAQVDFARLDGSTPDRGLVVRNFVADHGPKVMLLSLKAGGVGLNLTAADHVFLLDPWWNPAAEDQAADRAHRIGQQRPVLVHRLVAQDTVEEQILRLQAHKRALAEAALSSDGSVTGTTGGLSPDDLLALVGGTAA
jgi:SNF2 family DNA or RNA helicase